MDNHAFLLAKLDLVTRHHSQDSSQIPFKVHIVASFRVRPLATSVTGAQAGLTQPVTTGQSVRLVNADREEDRR